MMDTPYFAHCEVVVEIPATQTVVHREDVIVVFDREGFSEIPALYDVHYRDVKQICSIVQFEALCVLYDRVTPPSERMRTIRRQTEGHAFTVLCQVVRMVTSRVSLTPKAPEEEVFFPGGVWESSKNTHKAPRSYSVSSTHGSYIRR